MENTDNTNNKRNADIMALARHNFDSAKIVANGNTLLAWQLEDRNLQLQLREKTREVGDTLETFARWCEAMEKRLNGETPKQVGLSGEDCLNVIKKLSYSQGCYGRALQEFNELEPADQKAQLDAWEQKRFKDEVEFILYFENGE